MDEENAPWFNLFRISKLNFCPPFSGKTYGVLVFEMVSAFGGIGLTLGIPTENFSFSGSFKPLSKLIVCIIMLRGRHRGLPVAIDRASAFLCFEPKEVV
jgi:Trk-type K+ transport system membrane component